MINYPNNDQDTIDSREVISRIDDLDGQDNLDEDEGAELRALLDLAAQGEDYASDWNYGETLIRDSYFVEYAQELAESCGMVDNDVTWPMNHIDWQAAADQLQEDYTEVDFDGVTYWIR